jgi:outer membrane usher protein FimD/PapC
MATTRPAAKVICAALTALIFVARACTAAEMPYVLSYDRDKWTDEFSVFHLVVQEPFGAINSSMAASDDPRLHPLTRLDTALSFSAPLIHMPARVGDTVSSAYLGDAPVRMGGFQFGTRLPAIPDIVAPVLLDPGFAPANGAALVASSRIIEQVRTVSLFQQQALVANGHADYSVEAGRVREDFELRSNNYGPWLTSGSYRYGLYSQTTLDGQFSQLGAQQSVLGVGVLQGFGALGTMSAGLANSRALDSYGWLARMGYDYSRQNLSFVLRTRIQSPSYQSTADAVATSEPLRHRTMASAGMDLGSYGKISVASATQTLIDDSRRDVLALSHAMPLIGGGILSAAAAYSPGQFASTAWLLSFSFPFDYWRSTAGFGAAGDLSMDKTIVDAFNQTRAANPNRGLSDRVPLQ